ncbi:MAG: hypothetical protein QG639_393 [Patescibacteria group bacterium]|nr:hypothetical protein [Patescibacteria group bacterium]
MATKVTAQLNIGFTLVELLVVLGLFTVVFTLSNVSLSSMIARSSSQEFTQTLISDLSRQQNRAMTGEAASGSATSYGVRLTENSYTLFDGEVFSESSATNIRVQLPVDVQFENISLPQQQIVFQEDSGEISDFVAGQSSWDMRNTTTNTTQTFQVNRLGVITQSP